MRTFAKNNLCNCGASGLRIFVRGMRTGGPDFSLPLFIARPIYDKIAAWII
jgi:hypothetical protein